MSDTDRPDQRPVPAPDVVTSPDQVTIRRAPRFSVFILGGAVLGFLVTVVVVALTMGLDRGDQQETTGFAGLVGYFGLYGVSIGMLVGALVAVVLDRVSSRRAASLTAERVTVDPVPETVDGELEDHDGPATGPASPTDATAEPTADDQGQPER
ncbi:hypothetical protein DEJ16_02565 [Curtobacterium sp. MCJR17_055]|uniref:hypothetical protein n=1 Tax=unclassified Curtobacterium TaxID=257496 RepID=UPI000D8F2454|nr:MULTISPECIES: hypothetical protein [unclassified Curtobacterium]PYY36761.1 hypothetical protein DEI87_03580 [Curtobacterium sp. MCBD17_029]PYY58578.1 hypothetical protein DEJ16_02565 [Curtobacterium sp. MCJR17_055]PYY59880.1 hypothetical protein DEJ26_08345 [Curtobacterium sp. MCPF17_015]WIB36560.1 hypothetical protein DEJ15_05430 [Curtobacterium sp. MCJR17_043]